MSTWMTTLTDKKIQQAISDAKASGKTVCLTDGSTRGWGRLRLRINGSDKFSIYFRYVNNAGEQKDYPLGTYTIDTWEDVLEKAGEYSDYYRDGHKDLHEYMAFLNAAEDARIADAKRQATEAAKQAASGSLEALLNAYIDYLKAKGKWAAGEAEGIFQRHVLKTFPDLAAKPANKIAYQEINAVLTHLVKQGMGRTPGKLRSYLSASYSLALDAQTETDPTKTLPDLMGFNLVENPVAKIKAKGLAELTAPRERALSESELSEFLKILEKKSGVIADAVLLLLLLGGQRVAQLMRVTPAKVDLGGRVITLLDPKGKGRSMLKPHIHLVPITDRAAEIIARQLARKAPYLFSSDGKVPVTPATLSNMVAGISTGMVKAGTASEPFQLSDLRRTCETQLAKLKVSMDVRAHLLSHGLSGLQLKHYDKHSYWEEKKEALEIWDQHLKSITSDKEPDNVIQFHRKV